MSGRGRCEGTPELMQMSEAHEARILPAADSLTGLRVYPVLRFAIWFWTSDIRPLPAAAPPPFPRHGALKARIPCWKLRGSRHTSKDGTCLTVLFQMKRSACFCSTRSVNDGCVCEGRNRVRGVLDAAELPEYKVTKQYKVINAPWTFKLPRERSSGHTVREEHLVCARFHVAWWPSLGRLTQRPDGRWL